MTATAKETLAGIFVAAFIAVVVNAPLLSAILKDGELQWDDVTLESSDEAFYLTRIREVADGHPNIGNPYVFERRDQSYPLGNLWERILSAPMRAFGWSIKTVSLFGDAVLPFLCALLTWFAFRSTIPNKRWRALALGMIFLGTQVTLWKRPVSPQAITILPILWLWMFLSPAREITGSMLTRSALIGLMAYSYPFHWTYAAAAEVLLWTSAAWKDRRISATSLKSAACLALPFFVIALPWTLSALAMSQNHAYQETLTRLGLIDRRLPVGPLLQLRLLFCMSVVVFALWKKQNPWRTPLLTLLGAGVLMLWLPLITGKEAEFANHYGKILLFPMSLAVVFGVAKLTETSRVATGATMALLTFSLVSATLSTTLADARAFEAVRVAPADRTSLNEAMTLLQSLPPEQVILTENGFAQKLTVYTSHYPFAFYDAYMYLAPDSELVSRAELYNVLVPSDPLSPRGVYGTRYLNRVLLARSVCRIGHVFGRKADCAAIKTECPACAAIEDPTVPTAKDVLKELAEAHVTYVFLKQVPAQLKPYLKSVGSADGRTLYALSLPR